MKLLEKSTFLLLTLFLVACSTESTVVETNLSDFEITILSTTSNSIELKWSESFHSKGENVFYSVYLDSNLLKEKTQERRIILTDLNSNNEYKLKIVAFDEEENFKEITEKISTLSNQAPRSFKIENANPENISVALYWQRATDPDNDQVKYNVFINDAIVFQNLETTYCKIENLTPNTSYEVKVVAFDSLGNETYDELTFSTKDGVFKDSIEFNTQASLDAFGSKGYIEVDGSLTITDGTSPSDRITDLTAIKSLKKIRGNFIVRLTRDLLTLKGIEIEEVRGSLIVENNHFFESIEGLEKVKHIYGDLIIKENVRLKTFIPFDNLTQIGRILTIANNGVKTIEAFKNLEVVNHIYIRNNWYLESLIGFHKLKKMEESLRINDNTELSYIEGFTNLESVNNLTLSDIKANELFNMTKLKVVKGSLSISNLPNIKNLIGFSALEEIRYSDLSIGGNKSLESLEGLNNLKSIGNRFSVSNNEKLNDFCALKLALQSYDENYYTIRGNMFNPTMEEILNNDCKN
ncbi:fibronectin type III domain-containing protein [Tenacibaculum sp. ZS6-P6]|uniref:fibronectin type III domain-containing protein n=1 Tax=Tenacibaculum sp. ZS6-P6 TaxID=3447503 RepID=UPI003F9D9C72